MLNHALQAAKARVTELTDGTDSVVAATCRGLLAGYDARWRDEQSDILLDEVEGVYTAPLTNINSGRNSRTFTLAGKLDKLARDPAGVILCDHKTTSEDISDPTAPYWRQLTVDSQASHYELLLLANGIRVDAVVWDVVRKPAIRPKAIARAAQKQAIESGEYCGRTLSRETLAYLADTRDENAEMFEARVAEVCTDDPARYFARRSNPRTREQLAEYAEELWGVAAQIREARRNGYHFRNSGACFNYGRPCKFLGLCSGVDTPDSEAWQPKPKKSPELPDGIGGDDVLTNTRLRTFQTCRRKHYYEYELGIERVDSERQEALFFGTVWHEALDAWWRAMNERDCDGDCNAQPVGSAGSQRQTQLA